MWPIGEFSKISGLSVKTLRFYQEKGLLVPASVDESSGYRYYDAASLEKARVIVALRTLEFSLEEIGEILSGHNDEGDILAYLEQHKTELAAGIRRQREVVATLNRIIQTETEARQTIAKAAFRVEEKTIEPMLVAGLRYQGRYSDCGPRFAALGKSIGRWIAGKPLCLYFDPEYHDDDADVEPCFPVRNAVSVDGISVRELPRVRVVSLLHRGPYDLLGRSYAKAPAYANERRLEIALPTREVYLKGPGMIFKGNPRNYLTEIQLPVAE